MNTHDFHFKTKVIFAPCLDSAQHGLGIEPPLYKKENGRGGHECSTSKKRDFPLCEDLCLSVSAGPSDFLSFAFMNVDILVKMKHYLSVLVISFLA